MGPLTLPWEVRHGEMEASGLNGQRMCVLYSKCKEPTPQHTVLGQSMGENHALHGVNGGRDCILLVCQFILSADGRTKSCAGWTVVLPQGGESVMNGLPMVPCREEAW